jgi:hypothetical protein
MNGSNAVYIRLEPSGGDNAEAEMDSQKLLLLRRIGRLPESLYEQGCKPFVPGKPDSRPEAGLLHQLIRERGHPAGLHVYGPGRQAYVSQQGASSGRRPDRASVHTDNE